MFKLFSCIRYNFNPMVMNSLSNKSNKMKKLRQKYKMEKENSRKSGNGTAKKKQWKYSSKIDNITSEKHIVNPLSIMDTAAVTNHRHLKNDIGKFF